MPRLKDTRLEPKVVAGPIMIHVRNGGLSKDKPGRAYAVEKVDTLVTLWVPPQPKQSSGPVLPLRHPSVSHRKNARNTRGSTGSKRSAERREIREICNELAAEQRTVELDLRAAGFKWRDVEKITGGKYPETAAEFLSRYVNPQGETAPIAPRYSPEYAKKFQGTPPAIRQAVRESVRAA